ncbi:hypothetical protein [Winogradskyella endarachnes]|uniref:Uncharacterized protein n=1 Tax=Winogradskyella endarachnes TaxID=2681965 RepID=A0A6L6UC13_9FLAO|nr:hypothetical protein [Winogradskyella endarachnes]MUU79066.1 hypothetical protein [Winogradskyella endarachnes]
MRKVLVVFILLTLFCCEEKNKSSSIDKAKVKQGFLTVIVKATVLEDDIFNMFFSEHIFSQYRSDNQVSVGVKGSKKIQELVFNLPEEIYPVKLRFDVGSKKHNSVIKIDEVVFSSGNNKKIINSNEFNLIFKPNKHLVKTDGINTYKRQTINNFYDPFFITVNISDMVTNLFK